MAAHEDTRGEEVKLITKAAWVASDGWNVDYQKFEDWLNLKIDPSWDKWMCLDVEAPWWDAFRSPNQHTDAEAAESYAIYCQLIGILRTLRPYGKISLYNMCYPIEQDYPIRFEMLKELHRLCDGASPSMYLNATMPFQQCFNIIKARMDIAAQFCKDMEKSHQAWIWRYKQGDGLMSPAEAEQWFTAFDDIFKFENVFILGADKTSKWLKELASSIFND